MCPPEGDAGTGMVATNSVAPRTGNVSAGTSIFAMVVLEQQLSRVHRELDLVTTPAGDLVAMVHCNNGASELNSWVGVFAEFAAALGVDADSSTIFETLFTTALDEGELITAVAFPIPAKAGYAKFPHPASRFALTGVFVAKSKSGDVRVAVTGASQTGVMRVAALEAALKANWSAAAVDGVTISADGLMSDIHGSSDYRANLIKVMAGRAVTAAG